MYINVYFVSRVFTFKTYFCFTETSDPKWLLIRVAETTRTSVSCGSFSTVFPSGRPCLSGSQSYNSISNNLQKIISYGIFFTKIDIIPIGKVITLNVNVHKLIFSWKINNKDKSRRLLSGIVRKQHLDKLPKQPLYKMEQTEEKLPQIAGFCQKQNDAHTHRGLNRTSNNPLNNGS